MFNIPTYDEANAIIDRNDAFYKSSYVIDGYEVEVFNYRLAQGSDFVKEDAAELRGLTFVKQGDGSWKRFIMLHKFFNVNQTEGYMLEDLAGTKVVRTQMKFDGSMIRFIWAGPHNIVAKTKMGFDNDQAIAANRILQENETLYTFVRDTLNRGQAAIFEYVAPTNRIVIPYKEEMLILLQVRDEKTGEYTNIDNVIDPGVERAYSYDINLSIESLMRDAEVQEDMEGWVSTLDNGMMVKNKTQWYCDRHRLLTVDAYHENTIIEHILNETYDDLIAALDHDDPVRENMNNVLEKIRKWISHATILVEGFVSMFEYTYSSSRKDFAIEYNKDPLFSVVMKVIDGNEIYDELVNYIRRSTGRLETAREFLKDI
jgi:T4 RnlA family RNA ligase